MRQSHILLSTSRLRRDQFYKRVSRSNHTPYSTPPYPRKNTTVPLYTIRKSYQIFKANLNTATVIYRKNFGCTRVLKISEQIIRKISVTSPQSVRWSQVDVLSWTYCVRIGFRLNVARVRCFSRYCILHRSIVTESPSLKVSRCPQQIIHSSSTLLCSERVGASETFLYLRHTASMSVSHILSLNGKRFFQSQLNFWLALLYVLI